MAANFAYLNTRDLEFIIQEWLPSEKVFDYDQFKDYYSKDDIKAFLAPILKMAKEVVEPTNEDGDSNPVKLVDGKVILPKSFGPLFHQLQSEGWGTSNIDKSEDAMIMPHVLSGAVNELLCAANPVLYPYILLTSGAADLIQSFADDDLKEVFLPNMMDGTWAGTMCLTEPSAGSDVGDILSRAYPTDDPRIFKIKGQKIFITGGDNDFTDNIIHLYLARIEGAKPGTSGISLFIVPKFWVNEDGSLSDNDVITTGVEHKLGQHGSCTAALAFGDNGNCRGYLLGKNPLENDGKGEGMAQMFQMMNLARMETGHMAHCCIANAFYNTRDYAKDRVQGRPFTNPRGDRVSIINHEDIRRTLIMGKAYMEATRAMLMKALFNFDIREHDPDPEERAKAQTYVDIVTPLCKAYPSDEGWWLCGEAIQAYGGYGFCEEYPVAQIARDMKIYSIWEGTNFIQSLDLVGRKMGMAKGAAFAAFIQEIKDFCAANKDKAGLEKEFLNLGKALEAYDKILATLVAWKSSNPAIIPVFSHRVLTATSQLHAAHLLLDQALICLKKMADVGAEHYDYKFYKGKVEATRWYLRNVVPNVWCTADIVTDADTSALDIDLESFDY